VFPAGGDAPQEIHATQQIVAISAAANRFTRWVFRTVTEIRFRISFRLPSDSPRILNIPFFRRLDSIRMVFEETVSAARRVRKMKS